jgi:hypothetical protein
MPDETAPQLWSVNPYAVAEALLGRRIDWARGRELREQLRDLLRVADVRSLFVTVPGRQTLISVFRDLQKEGPLRWTVEECLRKIEATAELRPLLAQLDLQALMRALTVLVPMMERPPGSAVPPLVQGYRTLELPEVAVDRSYRDPAQGAAADCYLIAALIACAWTRPPQWRQQLAAAEQTAGEFDWQFFSEARPPRRITTDLQVPVGRDGRLVFARSDEDRELWPALFEKAYALWRRDVAAQPAPAQPTEAEILALGFGRPGETTAELLGVPHDAKLNSRTSSLTARLQSKLEQQASATPLPTTACSRQDDHEVWQIDVQAAPDARGQHLDDFIGLTPAHAYAVLGCTEVDGATYVILRNPHSADLQCPRWLQADIWQAQFGDGRVEPVALNRDGVFGLRADDFDRYFDRFDWAETRN